MKTENKNIEVKTTRYLGCNPNFEYTISINNIEIKLDKDDFNALIDGLSDKLSKEHQITVEMAENNERKAEKLKRLLVEVRNCFYHTDENNTFFHIKDKNEINVVELENRICDLDRILGF